MSDDYIDFFNKEFFQIYKPEEHLLEKANIAENKNNYSEAIMYLDSALLINPDNQQAKQKLLEIYLKAIQDVIDDGRYEDAYQLIWAALQLRKTDKSLILLKLKILALLFISKFYPEEEMYFESFWDNLKKMGDVPLGNSSPLYSGISFTGMSEKLDINRMASPHVAIVMLRMQEMSGVDIDDLTDECAQELLSNIVQTYHVNPIYAKQVVSFTINCIAGMASMQNNK